MSLIFNKSKAAQCQLLLFVGFCFFFSASIEMTMRFLSFICCISAVLDLHRGVQFSLPAVSRGWSLERGTGSSLWGPLLLWPVGSGCTGFSSCGARGLLPPGMWSLPGPGMEPASPASAGRFLTTGPLGESLSFLSLMQFIMFIGL